MNSRQLFIVSLEGRKVQATDVVNYEESGLDNGVKVLIDAPSGTPKDSVLDALIATLLTVANPSKE